MNLKMKRTLALLLAAVTILATASGCKKKEPAKEESSTSASEDERKKPAEEENPIEPPEIVSEYQVEVPKENREKLEAAVKDVEAKAADKTGKVVAWLNVPGTETTGIDKPVMWYGPGDLDVYWKNSPHEFYYERKNIYGAYDFNGCTFLDYSCELGKGTKDSMPQNAIMYAHHIGNPKGAKNDPTSAGEFSPLLNFREKDFAEKTPYIYLTTESEDLVYQVFAVSDVEAGIAAPLSYLYADYDSGTYKDKSGKDQQFKKGDFVKMTNEMRDRSYWDYKDVTVTDSDKIITLSTCVYDYGNYAQNNQQRFVVFAKLVKGKNFSETANIEENKDRKLPSYAK